MSLYIKNTLTKVQNLSRQAKFEYFDGNVSEALELIEKMEVKLKFVKAEMLEQQKVSA